MAQLGRLASTRAFPDWDQLLRNFERGGETIQTREEAVAALRQWALQMGADDLPPDKVNRKD